MARFARNVTENRGRTAPEVVENLLEAGYTRGSVIDIISLVGDKTISNYIHSTTQVPVDFPVAQPLELETV